MYVCVSNCFFCLSGSLSQGPPLPQPMVDPGIPAEEAQLPGGQCPCCEHRVQLPRKKKAGWQTQVLQGEQILLWSSASFHHASALLLTLDMGEGTPGLTDGQAASQQPVELVTDIWLLWFTGAGCLALWMLC